MSIKSNIFLRLTGTSASSPLDDYVNVPMYTDIGLAEYYELSSVNKFEIPDFGIWTEDTRWAFQIFIEDIRRDVTYSSSASTGTHIDIIDIPEDLLCRIYDHQWVDSC